MFLRKVNKNWGLGKDFFLFLMTLTNVKQMLKMPRVDFGISTCRVAKVYTWTFVFPRVAFKNVILSFVSCDKS